MRWFHADGRLLLTAFQLLVVLCVFAKPAYAYVDPGSGLLAFQIISTTFAGMIFMMRRRLQSLFHSVATHFGSKGEKDAR
jgi:hypothetical protein